MVSQTDVLFAPVAAWVLCAPKFLAGNMMLGELTQAAAAFVMVQAAFNWVVDNYQRLADWRQQPIVSRRCCRHSMMSTGSTQ